MTARPPAGLVLAAGSSTRMQAGFKLLLPFREGLVVHGPVVAALEAGLAPVVVVTGHRGGEVEDALRERFGAGAPVCSVRNPRHGTGQGTSLARGIRAVRTETEAPGAAVLLGDEPGVSPAAVRTVVEAWREEASAASASPAPVMRARYRDRPGHPVVFPRQLFPELESREAQRGARPWLERHPGRVHEVPLDRAAPADLDTDEDYRRATGGPDTGDTGDSGPSSNRFE